MKISTPGIAYKTPVLKSSLPSASRAAVSSATAARMEAAGIEPILQNHIPTPSHEQTTDTKGTCENSGSQIGNPASQVENTLANPACCTDVARSEPFPSDLQAVIDVWPKLPNAIKVGWIETVKAFLKGD